MEKEQVFEMVKLAKAALEDKKAEEIRVIDISDVSVLADYFIIAGGSNSSQIQALADSVDIHIKIAYMKFPMDNKPYRLLKKAKHTKYSSQNLTILYNNRIHSVIFRLQADMTVFFVKSFYSSRVINQCHNHFSVLCRIAGMYKYPVTIENTGINHGFPPDI